MYDDIAVAPTQDVSFCSYCESLAVGALTECYNEDEKKAQLLLTRTMPNFGNKTPLKLAMEADSKVFIAHVACQSVFDRIWMGKMAAGHHPVLVSTPCPIGKYIILYSAKYKIQWNQLLLSSSSLKSEMRLASIPVVDCCFSSPSSLFPFHCRLHYPPTLSLHPAPVPQSLPISQQTVKLKCRHYNK